MVVSVYIGWGSSYFVLGMTRQQRLKRRVGGGLHEGVDVKKVGGERNGLLRNRGVGAVCDEQQCKKM